MTRLSVAGLTRTPWACSHQVQCCSSVASGWAASWGSSPATSPARFGPGGPGRADAARLPVSRRRRRQRVIVGADTPNSRATSACRSPPSAASSTRMRRSFEYAFIPTG